MRASEVLGATVRGPAGEPLGTVLDVRLVQDGPLLGAFAAMRVAGLVVGSRQLAARLGYDRRRERGPLPVRWAVRRLLRHNRYLPWDQVLAWAPGSVTSATTELPPVPALR